MGNNEEAKSSKSDKSSSPAPQDQTNIHMYPDWAAMQAYYGPRLALPPYYNSTVASGHPPHPYMWGPPQPMMPPYGPPYAAVYSHGVYAHAAVPIGAHSQGPGLPTSPAGATPLSIETPTKSSGNTDRGLMKKLKGFDGLAMSIGNGNTSNGESSEGSERRTSESSETEGSSDGSDGNTATGRKRSREELQKTDGDVKIETQATSLPAGEVNGSPHRVLGAGVAPAGVPGKSVGPVSSGMTTALELMNPTAKTSPASVPQPCGVMASETWMQNERELKRERRKQSNRESARRSRLRKQAETEELACKVESLMAENVALKSEINQLSEKSDKLRLGNAALIEKLKNGQVGNRHEIMLNNIGEQRAPVVHTENLLSRVSNSASADVNAGEEGDPYDRNANAGAKLHQLLDTSPRADAVAAGC